MHFIVYWEYQSAAPNQGLIQAEFIKALERISWVRPLTNFYVVQVPGSQEYTTLVAALNAIPPKYGKQVHLLISPPMTGGQYTGYLPANLWAELNSRTK